MKLTNLVIIIVALVAIPSSVYAKDYKVEVIVFSQVNGDEVRESHRYTPPASIKSPSPTWYVAPTMLLEERRALGNSLDFDVLHHFSWGQESLPSSQAASMSFYESDFKGWVKVYARTSLYVNLDLDVNGYRMMEKRRIKLDEKHFFDHPKFGVLVQVSRLEYPEESSTSGESLE